MATQTSSPVVGKGIATYFGLFITLSASVGTIIAAYHNNDTATLSAGIMAALTALATIGGRMAQSVALIKAGIVEAAPVVDELAKQATPPAKKR